MENQSFGREEMCIRDRTDAARSFMAEEAYDPHYGARPVKRYLQKNVENELAAMIIRGDIVDGQTVRIDSDGSSLQITAV